MDPAHFLSVVEALHGKATLHVNLMMLPARFAEVHALGVRLAREYEHIGIALQPLFDQFSGPIYGYTEAQRAILADPQLPYHQDLRYRVPPTYAPTVYRGLMVERDGPRARTLDPNILVATQANRWQKWRCWTGVENLVIDPRGKITRGICGVGGIIGDVHDENFTFPEDAVICPNRHCDCAFDIMTTKENIFGL